VKWTVLALALAGCTPPIDDVVKEHGGRVESALEPLEGLHAAMEKLPLLGADQIKTPSGKLSLDVGDRPSDGANTALVYLEDLAELGSLGMVYARVPGTTHVSECASFLEHQTNPYDPRDLEHWTKSITGWDVEGRFELCERLTHLLVIRTTRLMRPSAVRVGETPLDSGSYASCETEKKCAFDGGVVEGEVHLYQLDGVEHLGGFRFKAESSEKVSVEANSPALLVEKDLGKAVAAQIDKGLASNLTLEKKGLAP
jgi:hypothetical protein